MSPLSLACCCPEGGLRGWGEHYKMIYLMPLSQSLEEKAGDCTGKPIWPISSVMRRTPLIILFTLWTLILELASSKLKNLRRPQCRSRNQLTRLWKKREHKLGIFSLMEPVQKKLQEQEWCWCLQNRKANICLSS